MKLTSPAKKLWEKIPNEVRMKLLNNVWCTTCATMRGIGDFEGRMEHGDLVLRGSCTHCGHPVARVIESN